MAGLTYAVQQKKEVTSFRSRLFGQHGMKTHSLLEPENRRRILEKRVAVASFDRNILFA